MTEGSGFFPALSGPGGFPPATESYFWAVSNVASCFVKAKRGTSGSSMLNSILCKKKYFLPYYIV